MDIDMLMIHHILILEETSMKGWDDFALLDCMFY